MILNPPFINKYSKSSRSPAVTKSATIYFPLWLSYAAGVLDKEGYTLKLIDAPARCITKEDCLEEIRAFNPDMVVVDTSTASINSDLAYSKVLKDTLPAVKIVLVGTHVSATVKEILPEYKDYVDFIARHEYDYTIPEIAKALEGKMNFEDVLGISYCENGEL